MTRCHICGANVESSTGRCPACGGWLAKKGPPEAPVLAILFFLFVCIISFVLGVYSILAETLFGLGGFVLLAIGWAAVWVIIFHYRPMLKQVDQPETMSPYER